MSDPITICSHCPYPDEIKELQNRLSHLMDVAKRMAECLLNVQIDLEDMDKDRHTDGVLADVIKIRAEWDGIKR